jgi:hypothetical protein
MENPLMILAVAMSPVVLGFVVWRAMSETRGVADGSSATPINPLAMIGPEGWRTMAGAVGVVLALVVIVGSMSMMAAVAIGAGSIAAAVLIRARGAIEPRIDVDSADFDDQLRGWLDDAA